MFLRVRFALPANASDETLAQALEIGRSLRHETDGRRGGRLDSSPARWRFPRSFSPVFHRSCASFTETRNARHAAARIFRSPGDRPRARRKGKPPSRSLPGSIVLGVTERAAKEAGAAIVV